MMTCQVYEGREEQIIAAKGEEGAAPLLEELSLVGRISRRVAALFAATGMELTAQHIEPLQLVRYQVTLTFYFFYL